MRYGETRGGSNRSRPEGGLVRESYNIDGISYGECGQIFIDWVLSLPVVVNTADCLRALIAHYGIPNPRSPDDPCADRGADRPRTA